MTKNKIRILRVAAILFTASSLLFSCKEDKIIEPEPEPEEFVQYTLNDKEYYHKHPDQEFIAEYNPASGSGPGVTYMEAVASTNLLFSMEVFGGYDRPGTYQINQLAVQDGSAEYEYFKETMPDKPQPQVVFTTYGAVDEYIIGTFSGQMKKKSDGTFHAISGKFKIKRKAVEPEPEEYVRYTLNGKEYYHKKPEQTFYADYNASSIGGTGTTYMEAFAINGSFDFSMEVFGGYDKAGTYSINQLILQQEKGTVMYEYFKSTMPDKPQPQVTFTTYGAVGEYITGTFSGEVKNKQNGTFYPVSGKFKVKRLPITE